MRTSRKSVEQELKNRIRSGVYAPGSRMPSHRQLQDDLQVSSATLQLAFDRLVEQGYVEPRGSHGTFVSGTLPSATRIALVFPEQVGQGPWNRFWGTAKRVADDWRTGVERFKPYCIQGQQPHSSTHQDLCRDLADGALAGIIFISSPFYLGDSPVFEAAIPRVVVGGGGRRSCEAFRASVIDVSSGRAIEAVLRRFAAEGRRRLGVLTEINEAEQFLVRNKALLRSLGIEVRTQWALGLPVSPGSARCARTVTHLLCSGPADKRPDCLLIADDNLVPHATAGIQDAGLRAPGDLLVAAHANFPDPTRSAVPALRFGPDLVGLLQTGLAEIRALAAGGDHRLVEGPLDLR